MKKEQQRLSNGNLIFSLISQPKISKQSNKCLSKCEKEDCQFYGIGN